MKVLHVAVWGTRPYKNVMSEAPIAMCWQCVNIAGYKCQSVAFVASCECTLHFARDIGEEF